MSERVDSIRDEVTQHTIETFDLVKNAHDSQVSRIYPLRAGEHENPDAKRAFNNDIRGVFNDITTHAHETDEKAKHIRMMGISLRQFFNDAGELYPVIEPALNNQSLSFQILLIDPFSTQAGFRAEREQRGKANEEYERVDEHFSSTLYMDIQKATKTLLPFCLLNVEQEDSENIEIEKKVLSNREIRKSKPRVVNRVEVRLYSTAPSSLLLFLKDRV